MSDLDDGTPPKTPSRRMGDPSVHYPWTTATRFRLIRFFKDLWSLVDRRVKISRIEESLYVGGKLTPKRVAFLRAHGVRAVVSLQEETLDPMLDLDAHLWLPSHDGRPPTPSQLLFGARFIQAQIDAGRTVYVHCHAGVGRAPTLVAVYLVLRGASPDEAIARIKAARRQVRMRRAQLDAVYACTEALSSLPRRAPLEA